ncbi:MAG: hypothetical protein H7A34_01485 [bacterium]|nr:hypothetical protein [bacterium]
MKELVDFVCKNFPSPDMFPPVKSEDGTQERKPSADEPYSARVFKIVSDPYIGQLTYLRVLSGFWIRSMRCTMRPAVQKRK